MVVKRITYPLPKEHYNKSLFQIQKEQTAFQMGTVFLKKGTRIPEIGFTRHPSYEISIIQKGKIEMLHENGSIKGYLKSGDVVYLEAFEAQAGNVLEDTNLIYILIKA
ncbi:hypothetical protein [Flagellimonas pacifica]|uniref:Cupin domain-containing protein n=1 Tax=Flagellimonas pacifica TaxID=1247520 RepID=A0A285MDS2_9FLAO|nr:hypothetical protein [Allomuricauda parva]SNY95322.1 hypothetical protein SAMN06265377_0990 [Allomuricauda parva]